MPLINGSLQIGRSAIAASQAGLTVTGNNMANAATESYSRQVAHMVPTQFTEVIPGKYTGTGVALNEIRRQVDEALNGRIRTAVGDAASHLVQQQALARVEATFNELTEADLSSRLNAFFQAWQALQNQPQDIAARSVVLQEGASLAGFARQTRNELSSIQQDLDAQVRFQVAEADSLASEIASLNRRVVTAEAGRAGSAAALRDQRDDMLRQLGELVNIRTHEAEGGAVNVYIGNDPLIQYADSRGLSYREELEENGNVLAQVVFTANDMAVDLASGKIHGLIQSRDVQVGSALSDLDTWTRSLMIEVNHLHSLGRGLDGLTSITSTLGVDDATASLGNMDETGLPWAASNGVFNVHLTDANGNTVTSQIRVKIGIDSADTTLNDLAGALSAVNNLTATVDGMGRLQIDADAGFTFGFSSPAQASDATNVLAVLGVNTFFEGVNGSDVQVRTNLANQPRLLAASGTGLAGDGSVAAAIGQLATTGVDSLSGVSLQENFNSIIGQIAARSRAAQDHYQAADVVVQTLAAERQSISGVSTDEEAINMIMFQRMFQGAARYIGLVDQMLEEVIAMLR